MCFRLFFLVANSLLIFRLCLAQSTIHPPNVVYGQPIPGSERIIRTWVSGGPNASNPVHVATPRVATRPDPPSLRSAPPVQPFTVRPAANPPQRLAGQPTTAAMRPQPQTPKFHETSQSIRQASGLSDRLQQSYRWRNRVEQSRRDQAYFDDMRRRGGATQSLAVQNEALLRQWLDVRQQLIDLSDRIDDASDRYRSTEQQFLDASSKLEEYGLTPTIGLVLRHKREQLIRQQARDSSMSTIRDNLQKVRQQQLALEMLPLDGSRPDWQTDQWLADHGSPHQIVGQTESPIRYDVRELLARRHRWVTALKDAFAEYHRGVDELDSSIRAFGQLSRQYRKLIDRHVIWIRDSEMLRVSDFGKLGGGMSALFLSGRSDAIGVTISRKWEAARSSMIALLLWSILIAVVRWRCKWWLLRIGRGEVGKNWTKPVRGSVAAILTVAVAVCVPAVLGLISRWLSVGIVSTPTLHASSAAAAAAITMLAVELARQAIRDLGWIDRHVDVDLPHRGRAMTYLTIVGLGFVLAAYVFTLAAKTDRGAWHGSLSRLGFIATMMLLAWTIHRTLRVNGGFAGPLLLKFGGAVVHQARLVIYLCGMGLPVVLIVLSALGYSYAAEQILRLSIWTFIALITALMVWPGLATLSTWVWGYATGTLPPPRQFDQYGEVIVDRGGDSNPDLSNGVLKDHYLELKYQLAFLCQCGLVVAGVLAMGWLWSDVLPIASVGNPVIYTVGGDAMSSAVNVAGQLGGNLPGSLPGNLSGGAGGIGGGATGGVGRMQPVGTEGRAITLLHLLLAAATMFVSFQIAKLVPAMFDAMVLQRVSFDEAMEHFVFLLVRGALFAAGLLIAGYTIGLRWQTIQWLMVGLMIGVGFGMQDMVGNLVGGFVVLFEKPAKLGDRISVGSLTGRVAMQRLRTTTLSDDQGREVIVPNRNFVQEEVINWMGAGRLASVKMEVSISRDKRSADVCRSLTELMQTQKNVLLSPAPHATLMCVGQTSQRIEVEVWIEDAAAVTKTHSRLTKVIREYLGGEHLLTGSQPKVTASKVVAVDLPAEDEEWMRAG